MFTEEPNKVTLKKGHSCLAVLGAGERPAKLKRTSYSKDQLVTLLAGDHISDEFRGRIKAALRDGSAAAIRSLGMVGAGCLPANPVSRIGGEPDQLRVTA